MRRSRPQSATVTTLIALALLAGCSDSSTEPAVAAQVGVWTLASLNGFPPPIPLGVDETEMGPCLQTLVGGGISVNADGTWSAGLDLVLECEEPGSGAPITVETTLDSTGTWSETGGVILFDEDGDDSFTGALVGNNLVIEIEDSGTTLVLSFTR